MQPRHWSEMRASANALNGAYAIGDYGRPDLDPDTATAVSGFGRRVRGILPRWRCLVGGRLASNAELPSIVRRPLFRREPLAFSNFPSELQYVRMGKRCIKFQSNLTIMVPSNRSEISDLFDVNDQVLIDVGQILAAEPGSSRRNIEQSG